jgi:UPI0001B7B314 related cluster
MRDSWIKERERAFKELQMSLEEKFQKELEQAKRKQWCAECSQEAIYFCCWNTSYCSYNCQSLHWPKHATECQQQQKRQQQSAISAIPACASTPDSSIDSSNTFNSFSNFSSTANTPTSYSNIILPTTTDHHDAITSHTSVTSTSPSESATCSTSVSLNSTSNLIVSALNNDKYDNINESIKS